VVHQCCAALAAKPRELRNLRVATKALHTAPTGLVRTTSGPGRRTAAACRVSRATSGTRRPRSPDAFRTLLSAFQTVTSGRMSNPKLHYNLIFASVPSNSNIRKSGCREGMRMLELDHWTSSRAGCDNLCRALARAVPCPQSARDGGCAAAWPAGPLWRKSHLCFHLR
jgi:hypothetical protein